MSEKWDSADGSGIMGPTVVTHVAYSGKERAPSEQNTNTYNKPDLARILVEGTKAVYGPEKSEQLNAEFARRRQQPAYRGSAEELTAIVNRVCGDAQSTEVQTNSVDSIDDVVEGYSGKPSMLKVAAKGTANLVNKTCWYYPFVGALRGKKQEEIAKERGENSNYYSLSNMAAELVSSTALTYACTDYKTAAVVGSISLVHSFFRWLVSSEDNSISDCTAGNILVTLPMYTVLYSIAAVKAIKNSVVNAYSSALQEEKQKLLEANQGHSSGLTGNPIINWDFVNGDKKHQQGYNNAGVRVTNSDQLRTEPQPMIVLTPEGEKFEYDEDLVAETERDQKKKHEF